MNGVVVETGQGVVSLNQAWQRQEATHHVDPKEARGRIKRFK